MGHATGPLDGQADIEVVAADRSAGDLGTLPTADRTELGN
jgi:hypothetical protein